MKIRRVPETTCGVANRSVEPSVFAGYPGNLHVLQVFREEIGNILVGGFGELAFKKTFRANLPRHWRELPEFFVGFVLQVYGFKVLLCVLGVGLIVFRSNDVHGDQKRLNGLQNAG